MTVVRIAACEGKLSTKVQHEMEKQRRSPMSILFRGTKVTIKASGKRRKPGCLWGSGNGAVRKIGVIFLTAVSSHCHTHLCKEDPQSHPRKLPALPVLAWALRKSGPGKYLLLNKCLLCAWHLQNNKRKTGNIHSP